LSCIRNHLVDETVTHIRDNVYTNFTDVRHGHASWAQPERIDSMRKIEYAKKHARKLLWSSSQVKRVQKQAEIDMQEVISFTVIKETHQDMNVDVVRFDMRVLC
jgi:hypothetical protein